MILNLLIWIDVQVLWIATLGKSRPGETISAASWSLYLDGKWQGRIAVAVIDRLFRPWGKDHCQQAYQWQIHLYRDIP